MAGVVAQPAKVEASQNIVSGEVHAVEHPGAQKSQTLAVYEGRAAFTIYYLADVSLYLVYKLLPSRAHPYGIKPERL
jgi:hypothetical protein